MGFIIAALGAVTGVLFSGLALYNHVAFAKGLSAGTALCKVGSTMNCHAVIGSKYSEFLGIPLASLGLWFFLVAGYLLYSWRGVAAAGGSAPQLRIASLLLGLSELGLLVSVGLFALSYLVIKAVCPICGGMYLSILLIFGGSLSILPGRLNTRLIGGLEELGRSFRLVFSSDDVGASALYRRVALFALATFVLSIAAPALIDPFVHAERERSRPADANQSSAQTAPNSASASQIPLILNDDSRSDYYRGSKNASVILVEFADYECSACRHFHDTVTALLSEFGDRILYVFKNYPLDSRCNPSMDRPYHQRSCEAALAVRCAGEQNRFWEAFDLVFTDDSVLTNSSPIATQLARRLQLDEAELLSCSADRRHRVKIAEDVKVGDALGLGGTPFLLLNGRPLANLSKDTLRSEITAALSATSSTAGLSK